MCDTIFAVFCCAFSEPSVGVSLSWSPSMPLKYRDVVRSPKCSNKNSLVSENTVSTLLSRLNFNNGSQNNKQRLHACASILKRWNWSQAQWTLSWLVFWAKGTAKGRCECLFAGFARICGLLASGGLEIFWWLFLVAFFLFLVAFFSGFLWPGPRVFVWKISLLNYFMGSTRHSNDSNEKIDQRICYLITNSLFSFAVFSLL